MHTSTQTPAKINFNASKRHHWLEPGVCLHCGLKRKIARWKELVTTDGKKDLIYRHKMVYFFTVPDDALDKRPRCIGSGALDESDFLPPAPANNH